ncbi:MAG: NTP transferase domain-containing protein [Spirochaetales bacterium]|nr:NTP transferase domain-containing protein [Spirochaetales bacterium]
MNIDCLIPAAGLSSRMGKWKLTLPYKGSTIVENSIINAISTSNRVILVTGHRSEELTKIVRKYSNVFTIENKKFENGMFSSIQTGVKLIKSNWFFITMGDMPDIGKDIYINLIKARNNNTDNFDIIRPMYLGKRGHPVLLHKKTIKTILTEPISSEMKNIFTHFRVLDIEMNMPDTFRDIDTPEEYSRILENK